MPSTTYQTDYLQEHLRVDAWGKDSLRIRLTRNPSFSDNAGALLETPEAGALQVREDGETTRLTHGNLRLELVRRNTDPQPRPPLELRAVRVSDGRHLWTANGRRRLKPVAGRLWSAELACEAFADEHITGLGQHPNGFLNQKGSVIDLVQVNTEVCIPWMVSSRGIGLLWNHPGTGRVELATNHTRWTADALEEIDLWITTADTPAGLLAHYADATGHAPAFPEYASGFWQCKLRYQTQEELLQVAREHKRRGLPLSVIVADYFHWDKMGEWRFDPACWPDPDAMVAELKEMGVELMVSVWPTVNPGCSGFAEMERRNLLLQTERGVPAVTRFVDTYQDDPLSLHHIDPTNPEARAYLWSKIKSHYHDKGIRIFWLDACEPELKPCDPENVRLHRGSGPEALNHFPKSLQQCVHEGLTSAGETGVLTLCRSAWAGSQRYGAAVWSGDIPSTFESLAIQIRAGLNMAMSGIPWWCTDIGGFHSGDPSSEYFRELIVRWFQYGLFCPIFRLHGVRQPETFKSGGPNELWSFGDEAYPVLCNLLRAREALRPYIHRHMRTASETGLPLMRPLLLQAPDDPAAWSVEDQFFFGPDFLVAPVTGQGATSRAVYLPRGTDWVDLHTGNRLEGGQTLDVDAPLNRIPVFLPHHAVESHNGLAEFLSES